MVHTPVSIPESAFCRGCGYDLHGLDKLRCPECGRAFAPDDPRSYVRSRTVERRLPILIAMYVGPLAIVFLSVMLDGFLTANLAVRLCLGAYAACGPIGLFVHGLLFFSTTVWITFTLVWTAWLCVVARTRIRRLHYGWHFLLGSIWCFSGRISVVIVVLADV